MIRYVTHLQGGFQYIFCFSSPNAPKRCMVSVPARGRPMRPTQE